MVDDESPTEIDVIPASLVEESTPFHPASIAPLAVDVVPPLSFHERSTSFSWPPPAPARPSPWPVYLAGGLSIAAVLGLLVSFALTSTVPAPAAVAVPRTVEIVRPSRVVFTSAPATAAAR